MYSEDDAVILNRMKNNVPSDIDKAEGSFIHDALSPIALELAQQEINLDDVLKRAFVITAAQNGYSEELENRCLEQGVTRKQGTNSTGQVTFTGSANTSIPDGTIVQTVGGLQYKTVGAAVISAVSVVVNIEAVDVGIKYNVPASAIVQLPVQVAGVTSIVNYNPTTGGTDIESDDDLLQRYLTKVQQPSSSGNVSDYIQWAEAVDGVGAAKVFPLWNGNGTVKVCIVDSNKQPASADLLNSVQSYIESVRPIGASITYEAAKGLNIDISAKVVLADGFTLQQVQDDFCSIVNKYLSNLAFNATYVSYAKLGSMLLTTEGVVDYNTLTLNSNTVNVALQAEEIPVAGNISLGV